MELPEPTTLVERSYYSASIAEFRDSDVDSVLGHLTARSEFDVDLSQRDAWRAEIDCLQFALASADPRGHLFLEFVVPRLGRRIDAVVILRDTLFVLEFKIGERVFTAQDIDQAWDYALDLKNFHETSHRARIKPAVVISGVHGMLVEGAEGHGDGVSEPARVSTDRLGVFLQQAQATASSTLLEADVWQRGKYRPTPTIIEAASALYRGHSVSEISRSDAGAMNLARTSHTVAEVIRQSRARGLKSICLVTGVPGAGKTLVGLNIATQFQDPASELHSVYLSGNGPLVAILREALVRDRVTQALLRGQRQTKRQSRQAVESFIQPIHHFRDECLRDTSAPPEHVTIFDEAQRAWNVAKTAEFMRQKKNRPGFAQSEPAFLISCLDRHQDWAVIVCLVGGGQEINTGEAGISEWLDALQGSYAHWDVHLSPTLTDSEYAAGDALRALQARANVFFNEDLHLSVSMRSYRAEHVSAFVKKVLDLEAADAAALYRQFSGRYPVVLTRTVAVARSWLRKAARGSERYGIVVSSQAQRLKPHAIDVRVPIDPVKWFLNGKDDVRSSYYLEDATTEFHVQGLELDWTGVVWDADLRLHDGRWEHHSFVGHRWQHIRKTDRQLYLKNAYRVLLTRARQGMVIVVPEGSDDDPTRSRGFYDGTYAYLRSLGLTEIG